ncbi:HNH endonuclease [Psychrobacter sp. AOP7-C1-14]|uniref:HNH endonuclease n=1 Tax=Psychrobacter sp. AOP7-C1-14 TaxID=3457640 RepID=UPI00402B27CC
MFEIGKVYNRRADIHGRYKGQQYGGIATPAAHPYIFIFTGDSGNEYGYIDDFDPNGTFKYTGEGQEGDMKMSKGNLAIRDHQKNNKEILLFEYTSRGYVRLLGTCNYIFHHTEERPDRNGNLREAIIFHLDIVNTQNINAAQTLTSKTVESPKAMYITKPSKGQSLQKLRKIALISTPTQGSTQEKIQSIQNRSRAIKLYAKNRANGICEGCNEIAPFETKSGPYLEVHHLTRLADGGPDVPQNVIALCPTCHRRAHYSLNHLEFNSQLINEVAAIEAELNQ